MQGRAGEGGKGRTGLEKNEGLPWDPVGPIRQNRPRPNIRQLRAQPILHPGQADRGRDSASQRVREQAISRCWGLAGFTPPLSSIALHFTPILGQSFSVPVANVNFLLKKKLLNVYIPGTYVNCLSTMYLFCYIKICI